MNWFKRFASTSREVKILTALGVVNNVGTGLAAPILLLFVNKVIGADLAFANMAVSITAVAALFSHFIAARLSRTIEPVYICAGANALSALGSLLYAQSTDISMVVLGAVLTGCGLAASTGWFAVLGSVASDDEREFAFGVNQLSVNVGYSLGLALSSFAAAIGGASSYRCLFLGKMAGHILLAFGLIRLFAKMIPSAANDSAPVESADTGRKYYPEMIFLSVLYFALVFAGLAQLDSAIPSSVIEFGEDRLGWSVASLMLLDTIGTCLFNVFFSAHLSTFKPKALLLTACASWILSWIAIWLGVNLGPGVSSLLLPLGICLFAFGEIPAAMVMPALTYRSVPEDACGEAFGYQNVASSLAFIAAPLVTGLCIEFADASVSLIVYAALLITMLPLALSAIEKMKMKMG